MAITNKIGAPVTGEDFFGRTNELAKAHRYLNEGQSLLLSAPRRIGKSSLAKKIIADKLSDNWKCVYIDLQGIATKENFLRKLINSFTGVGLMEKTVSRVKNFLGTTFYATENVELGPIKIDLKNREFFEGIYNNLSDIFDHSKDTLIVIDELPLFLGKLMDEDGNNRDEVEFLLNWFRSIRQYDNSHIRWIFCGSVGLRNFTNHHRMSKAINDLIDFHLGELNKEEAKGLMMALSKSYNLILSDNIADQTLEILQWPIPYFIQLLIDRLITNLSNSETNEVTIDDALQAIKELSHSDYFMTWDERLDEYRELEDLARKTLESFAVVEQGLSKEKLLQVAMKGIPGSEEIKIKKELTKVLEMLEHDGYIIRSSEIRKFRSPLLREWWKYKFID